MPALWNEISSGYEILRVLREGDGMRLAVALVLLAPLHAAVDGTVVNATTGKPQGNVVVSLVQPGKDGMQMLGSTKSDPQGKFQIGKNGEGPQLVQALYDGVTYNKVLTPGASTSGVQVEVFDVTKDPQALGVPQHIIFLQPTAEQLAVTEVYLVKNETRQTLNNPSEGTLHFYVAGHTAQEGGVRVSITAPGGMPVQRPAEATNRPGVYKVNFPVKPGETEFNISYALPMGKEFASKSVQRGVDTKFVVPRGITLDGAGITALGTDPSGKAALYSTAGQEFSFKISGSAEGSAGGGPEDDSGQPQIAQANPRVYGQLPIVLGLAVAILLLGLVVLYRAESGTASPVPPKAKSRR